MGNAHKFIKRRVPGSVVRAAATAATIVALIAAAGAPQKWR